MTKCQQARVVMHACLMLFYSRGQPTQHPARQNIQCVFNQTQGNHSQKRLTNMHARRQHKQCLQKVHAVVCHQSQCGFSKSRSAFWSPHQVTNAVNLLHISCYERAQIYSGRGHKNFYTLITPTKGINQFIYQIYWWGNQIGRLYIAEKPLLYVSNAI